MGADKVEMAIRQLERAELYVASAVELDLDDGDQRRLLEALLADLAAARRTLSRPRVVQAFSRYPTPGSLTM